MHVQCAQQVRGRHLRHARARPANEALGAGRPIVAVPNPHVDLARHPAFGRNVELLCGCGVQVLYDPDRYPLPDDSNDPCGIFPWDALKPVVTGILSQVRSRG